MQPVLQEFFRFPTPLSDVWLEKQRWDMQNEETPLSALCRLQKSPWCDSWGGDSPTIYFKVMPLDALFVFPSFPLLNQYLCPQCYFFYLYFVMIYLMSTSFSNCLTTCPSFLHIFYQLFPLAQTHQRHVCISLASRLLRRALCQGQVPSGGLHGKHVVPYLIQRAWREKSVGLCEKQCHT